MLVVTVLGPERFVFGIATLHLTDKRRTSTGIPSETATATGHWSSLDPLLRLPISQTAIRVQYLICQFLRPLITIIITKNG